MIEIPPISCPIPAKQEGLNPFLTQTVHLGSEHLPITKRKELLPQDSLLAITAVDPDVFRVIYTQGRNGDAVDQYVALLKNPQITDDDLAKFKHDNLDENFIDTLLRALGLNDTEPILHELSKDEEKPISIYFSTVLRYDITTNSRLKLSGLDKNGKLLIAELDLDPHNLDSPSTVEYRDDTLVINNGPTQLARLGTLSAEPDMRAQLYALFATMSRSGEQPTAYIGPSYFNQNELFRFGGGRRIKDATTKLHEQTPVKLQYQIEGQSIAQEAAITIPSGTKLTLKKIICDDGRCQVLATVDPLDIPQQTPDIPTFISQVYNIPGYIPEYPYNIILDLDKVVVSTDHVKPSKKEISAHLCYLGITHNQINIAIPPRYQGPPISQHQHHSALSEFHRRQVKKMTIRSKT